MKYLPADAAWRAEYHQAHPPEETPSNVVSIRDWVSANRKNEKEEVNDGRT